MSPTSRFRALRSPGAVELSAIPVVAVEEFRSGVLRAAKAGLRLCALFSRSVEGGTGLCAVLADDARGLLYILFSEPTKVLRSLTPELASAHLFEREIGESSGIEIEGHPWLKSVRKSPADKVVFFRESGAEVHEVAVGPIHAGIIEPGHFRFQCHGETVHHLEIQLGYQHRGVEALFCGGPDRRSVFVAESVSGDTAVGHTLAYCANLESLGGARASLRGEALRAASLELERLANHVGDLGAMSGDVGFLPAAAYFGRLRGEFLNLLMALSGNRYGRGLVRPGGAAFDLTSAMAEDFSARLARARTDMNAISGLLFESASVLGRFDETGVVSRQTARDLGFVGLAARASGLDLDVRRDHPHGLYRFRHIPVVKIDSGDVYARAMLRHLESLRSLDFLEELIADLPRGDACAACSAPRPGLLAVSLVEGWRGEICHVAETGDDGRFRSYRIVDPSFHNWPAVAMAMRGGEISDFPLCNKSFNLSYAGHDL
ncbi:MAG: hydrogenase [Elusimicrobia bacterium]|nr:hydrogenase [Elusimicrobiota bacterium]